jgi:hypothetical protein
MTFRDVAGQPLSQGDSVFFGTAFGQAIVGTVEKTDSVLTASQGAQPMVHVTFTLSLPAMPNGLVGGVLKIVPPSTPTVGQA